jgi:hypothetical protein
MPKREKIVFIVPHKNESKSMNIWRYMM